MCESTLANTIPQTGTTKWLVALFIRHNQITQTWMVLPAPVREDRLWSV